MAHIELNGFKLQVVSVGEPVDGKRLVTVEAGDKKRGSVFVDKNDYIYENNVIIGRLVR